MQEKLEIASFFQVNEKKFKWQKIGILCNNLKDVGIPETPKGQIKP